WDAMRGELHERPTAWLRHRPADALIPTGELIIPDALRDTVARMPALLSSGEVRSLIVRGPRHGGRRTLVGAVARALGRGLLEVTDLGGELADERARTAATLATLLHAMPAMVLDPGAGETVALPAMVWADGPLAVVLGRFGGVTGTSVEQGLTVTLEMPDPAARLRHWRAAGGIADADLDATAARFRMTSGNIQRTARLARSHAALAGRTAATLDDVQQASRALHRQALDTLAARLDTAGDWSHLAVGGETQRELWDLE